MTDIPEDVMKAAVLAHFQVSVLSAPNQRIEIIARAILAERERGDAWKATAIAENKSHTVRMRDTLDIDLPWEGVGEYRG